MTKIFVAVLVMLAAVPASAATLVSGKTLGVDSPQAGMKTFTLTATSDAGKIIGFNFAGTGGSGLGFAGAMNQVNPFASPTIFNDTPDALYGAAGSDRRNDSHFLVLSAGNIVVGESEGANKLEGAWNATATGGLTNTLAFAQIVLPVGGQATFLGDFTVETPTGNILERVSGIVGIPEPASLAMAGMGLIGLVGVSRRRKA